MVGFELTVLLLVLGDELSSIEPLYRLAAKVNGFLNLFPKIKCHLENDFEL